MLARIGALLLGITVALTCLLFWPLVPILLCATVIESTRVRSLAMTARIAPARLADSLVGKIADHKAGMLAFSIFLAASLIAVGLIVGVFEHEGPQLTQSLTDAGGYIAVVGLVLGLPALGYAMVTDRAVDKIASQLRLTKAEVKTIDGRIGDYFARVASIPDEHYVQVFIPNPQRTLLVPIYDPEGVGPNEGWEIDDLEAPQAITGSAWVCREYLWATGDRLLDPGLRLTPTQQERYRQLTGVAAAPAPGPHDDDDPVGVLTIFTDAKEPLIDSRGFYERHRALAHGLAPLLRTIVAPKGPLFYEQVEPSAIDRGDSGRAPM